VPHVGYSKGSARQLAHAVAEDDIALVDATACKLAGVPRGPHELRGIRASFA